MATDTDIIHKEGNIKTSERIIRAAVAVVMFAYPMVIETSLIHLLAFLPLIAIYPMFTAIVGWDPVLFAKETGEFKGKTRLLSVVARIILVLVGTMMIVATLTFSNPYVGWYSLLALFAIVPIMIAIMAENPIQALRESNAALRDSCKGHIEQSVVGKKKPGLDESVIDNVIEGQHKKAA